MPKKPLAPGLQRLQRTVQRGGDPDDTANDPTLRPGWKPPTSPVATAGAGFRANQLTQDLAVWASKLGGAPPHSQEAARKSMAKE
jgi:hypothetical protein